MRDYGKVYTALWRSRKFTRLKSDDARLLYLYLHTCPHGNMIGCFTLPEGYALTDLEWPSERYRKAMESLCKASLVGFDTDESLVRIVDFIKHDPFTNPNHAAGAVKIAQSMPDCEQKQLLMDDLRGAKHVNLPASEPQKESLSKGSRNPEPEPEPEPKKEGGGGVTREPVREDGLIWRILHAIGFDRGQTIPKYWIAPDASLIVTRWQTDLGLSEDEIIEIAKANAVQHGEAAKGPKTLNRAMADYAAAKSAPPMQPTAGGQARASPQAPTLTPADLAEMVRNRKAKMEAERAQRSD